MENSILIGFSHQQALKEQMDIVSNNIANMSTPGYRAQNMIFAQYLSKPKGGGDAMSMVMDYGQFQSTAPGPMQRTGNPLDVALEGPGYFGVQTPQGVMYSRAGNFQLNADGELVTGAGDLVASEGGSSITIPPGATDIKIASDGTIATQAGPIGKLMIKEFANEQALDPVGNGLYKSPDEGKPAENTKAVQGMLEGSNVQPVTEMTRMVDILRSYENASRTLQNEHDLQRTMIQRLSRVS